MGVSDDYEVFVRSFNIQSMHKAHFFNPTCEMEVANGELSYTPPAHLQKMTQDLEVLPAFYAAKDDVVIVRQLPDDELLARWRSAGFYFANFKIFNQPLKAYEAQPWGWSPAVGRQLAQCEGGWNNDLLPFFHRSFAASVVYELMNRRLLRIISEDDLPVKVDNMNDVENLLTKRGKVVIKAPLSSSGRGIQILRNHHLDINIFNKTKSIIKQQGAVMIEPLLDKLDDFAFEFEIRDHQIYFVAYSAFVTNDNGQYAYHRLPFSPDLFNEEARQLWDSGVINSAKDELLSVLQESGLCDIYQGYLGVDAMVFRNSDNEVLLQPCVEINLRYNMGILALHLESHIAEGSTASFRIEAKQDISFHLYDIEMQNQHPLEVIDDKIVSGYLPLTPPADQAHFMAYLLVCKK